MEALDLPLVTIITPSYNQGLYLDATIRSVLEQDYPHIEYIIIDGGSTDESQAVIQRYADRLAYWESMPDRGQAHAVNKGLQRARGEILGWLNSDDLLAPGAVSQAMQAFQDQPEIDVVYGRLARIDAAGRLVPTPLLPKDRIVFDRAHVIGECIVNQPGAFWRRDIMQQVGWLDESLTYSLDYEYWSRMALAGARFKRLDKVVAFFRLSEGSKTVSQTAAMAVEQFHTLEHIVRRVNENNLPPSPGTTSPETSDLAYHLDIPAAQVEWQARQVRARIALRAAYGYAKLHNWPETRHWLSVALHNDPAALLERRYFDLALASLRRRLM